MYVDIDIDICMYIDIDIDINPRWSTLGLTLVNPG